MTVLEAKQEMTSKMKRNKPITLIEKLSFELCKKHTEWEVQLLTPGAGYTSMLNQAYANIVN